MGRHSEYNVEIATRICDLLIDGLSLREICRKDEYPCPATVFNWMHQNPDFLKQYTHAREIQAETLVDEILEIADDGSNDWETRKDSQGNEYQAQNPEVVARSRLRVDTRKWAASKMLPKKYGEYMRNEHHGPDGGAIIVQVTPGQAAIV
jgi:hypothetical protein